jgi:hypothetical protein
LTGHRVGLVTAATQRGAVTDNGLATAFIAAGFFAPLAALFYGVTDLRIGARGIVGMACVCLAGGAFLHAMGWVLLRRLRE